MFLSGTLIGGVMFAMLMAITFLLPVFMQKLLGFAAMQSGMALMPRSLIMIVVMPIVGRLYNKVQPRIVVGFGILCFAVIDLDDEPLHAADEREPAGAAAAHPGRRLRVPVRAADDGGAVSRSRATSMADATGLNSLLRQIGGSLGLAVFATLMTRYPRADQSGHRRAPHRRAARGRCSASGR